MAPDKNLSISLFILYYVHDIFPIFQWCPKWIAPNLLTFAGFLFTVLNFIIFSYYDYGFYASSNEHPEVPAIPQWVWAVAALNIFLAYTLGKLTHEAFIT
jgi:ethanolaminephosphotransferase